MTKKLTKRFMVVENVRDFMTLEQAKKEASGGYYDDPFIVEIVLKPKTKKLEWVEV